MALPSNNIVPIPKNVITIYYLVDASGSMWGTKINSVNSALKKLISIDLPKFSEKIDAVAFRVAILQFSSECEWVTPGPVEIKNIVWKDLGAGGLTNLGAAFSNLEEKMPRNESPVTASSGTAPIIILLTDGGPTDEWKTSLAQLNTNRWFRHAIKIAIAIGEDADQQILAQFTGTSDAVISSSDADTLETLIRDVSTYAVEFQSNRTKRIEAISIPVDDSAEIARKFSSESSRTIIEGQGIDSSIANSRQVCPQCGSLAMYGAKFCFNCGFSFNIESSKNEPKNLLIPYNGDQPFIFFSYSHKNMESALKIIHLLQNNGFYVWYDEGIDPGTEYRKVIAKHVESCTWFMSLISDAYLASEFCSDEIFLAKKLKKKQLLVYLEDSTLPIDWMLAFDRLQAIHYYTYSSDQAFLEKFKRTESINECHKSQ